VRKEVFVAKNSELSARMQNFLAQHEIRCCDDELTKSQNLSEDLYLTVHDDQLAVVVPEINRKHPFSLDLLTSELKYKRRSTFKRSDLLAKAVGLKGNRLKVLDATAGWLGDSFHLACLGATVVAVERDERVYLLSADALDRAVLDSETSVVVEDVRLLNATATELDSGMRSNIDVVFFDPMFPSRNKSALPNKGMQIMQSLVGLQSESELVSNLEVFMSWDVPRVVVKRRLHDRPLLSEPQMQYKGKSVRYDVYFSASIDSYQLKSQTKQ